MDAAFYAWVDANTSVTVYLESTVVKSKPNWYPVPVKDEENMTRSHLQM